MCPAEPFPQVRNLVVLGLKLRRLPLQFGLELGKLRPESFDFSRISLGLLGSIRTLWSPQSTAIWPSLPGLLSPG